MLLGLQQSKERLATLFIFNPPIFSQGHLHAGQPRSLRLHLEDRVFVFVLLITSATSPVVLNAAARITARTAPQKLPCVITTLKEVWDGTTVLNLPITSATKMVVPAVVPRILWIALRSSHHVTRRSRLRSWLLSVSLGVMKHHFFHRCHPTLHYIPTEVIQRDRC